MCRLLVSLVALALSLGLVGRASAQDEAHQILEDAIKAHGGADNLARIKAGHTRTQGSYLLPSGDPGATFKQDTWFELPDRVRSVMTLSFNKEEIEIVTVLNAGKGWVSKNGVTAEIDAGALAQAKEELYFARLHWLVCLRDSEKYQLTPLGEARDRERPARLLRGIKVSSRSHEAEDLEMYFDKETNRLRETDRSRRVPPAVVNEIYLYDNFRQWDKVWSAGSVSFHRGSPIGDNKILRFFDAKVSLVEFHEKYPDGWFAKP